MRSLLLQLSDSAFPSGAFAHSLGLESLRQLGQLRGDANLVVRMKELVWHTACSSLPFLVGAYVGDAATIDRRCHVFLATQIANRASRAQGAAFLLAAQEIFGERVVGVRDALPHGHGPTSTGAVLSRVGVDLDEARELFLFGAVRTAMSAAVRLGVVGPLRAQAILFSLHDEVAAALHESANITIDDAVNVSPLLELCQGAHDRLYARLFQS